MRWRIARRNAALAAFAIIAVAALHGPSARATSPPRVEVSLKPVHALVAGVMAEIAVPGLLVRGGNSPHTYALRPSEARRIADSDLVFWVSKYLEVFLVKPLSNLPPRARAIELTAVAELDRLTARRGGVWQGGARDSGESSGDAGGAAVDPHIWLDPMNAKAIVRAVARALADADPANASRYAANAGRVLARLDALDAELRTLLAPVKGIAYAVFHDSYQYFERRYGLRAIGALSVSPERPPGAKRIKAIRARLRETGARCLFGEPQFEPALLRTVADGIDVRAATLDPLGADLAPGVEAYFTLLRRLARNLRDCLVPGS